MSARDDLYALADVIGDKAPNAPHIGKVAAAQRVLAAGYTRPRTVSTVEELDGLAVESVVRSAMGSVYVKDYDLDDPTANWWVTAGAVSEFQSNRIALPATVLYEPTA